MGWSFKIEPEFDTSREFLFCRTMIEISISAFILSIAFR